MSAGRKAAGHFMFWLLIGLAAGVFLAAVLSYGEYQTVADIAGSVLETDSLAEGLKKSFTGQSLRQEGKVFLDTYGYRPMGKWSAYLPFTAGVSILLFQIGGWITFKRRRGEDRRVKSRIRGLTEYLRAVNSGEGAALSRNEDDFSHLEDEMYKTVMELRSTKEAAVKNHEVLAERIADIAHQLKTPLTSMSLMTELLEEYQTAETKVYYSRLYGQIERLKNLVKGLLALAKLDSHGLVFCKERLVVSELVEAVGESLMEMMEERRITLVIEESCCDGQAKEEAFIFADRQWTEEALLNLLKNCVEHTPKGGRIVVSYSRNPIYTELRMEDGGIGFAAKDIPHLFERFYRGKGAANDNAGIGLALAKAVVERQNGRLLAENTAEGHACFRVKWYML
ncbi:sensor protein SphS [Lachnospiraceae bacterium]|nr:sensor protein SphS [Lachnospiraceae bacterium]